MTARLAPIEHPTNPVLKVAYWLSTRYFGKVVTPLKVFYARKCRLLFVSGHIGYTLDRGLSLEPALRLLVRVQATRLNGCAFCQDLVLADAIRHRLGVDRVRMLPEYQTSALFTARERAALTLVEEMLTIRHVSDATWAALRHHFTDTEIVELVWATAAESFFNLQAAALGFDSDRLAAFVATRYSPPGSSAEVLEL